MKLIVEFDLDRDAPDDFGVGVAENIHDTLFQDYGPDAWGGYDGPRVANVKVGVEEEA